MDKEEYLMLDFRINTFLTVCQTMNLPKLRKNFTSLSQLYRSIFIIWKTIMKPVYLLPKPSVGSDMGRKNFTGTAASHEK
mgnify:CR=1 FL=1